jgi:hypothetical protein
VKAKKIPVAVTRDDLLTHLTDLGLDAEIPTHVPRTAADATPMAAATYRPDFGENARKSLISGHPRRKYPYLHIYPLSVESE